MYIERIGLKNFTVFKDVNIKFSEGINVFVGENGMGKTHIMKVLYSACQAASVNVSFTHKLVRTLLPDDSKISRLSTRKLGSSESTKIRICGKNDSDSNARILDTTFNHKTKKYDAPVIGEEGWETSFNGASSIFIPAKEILSHSYNLPAAVAKNNVMFDDTYVDVINSAKIDISVGRNSQIKNAMLNKIEKMTDGKVLYDESKDEFYLKKGQSKQEFNLVAEGIRKMALLWQLVKNGTLEKGSVLFWDEPEANINPVHIAVVVELLLMLQREGVQIFVATHDYFLAKYIDIKRTEEDKLQFYSLYTEGVNEDIKCEEAEQFGYLDNNAILETFRKLYMDEIGVKI
jgi:predicted ATP-dependent endonuclease of OLD family